MKRDCKYCGHKDNKLTPLDCDIDRHIYDWYSFVCDICSYTCSLSIKHGQEKKIKELKYLRKFY